MNTKGILMSILMIGIVATAAGAGTLAFFSDVEVATDNTFTAGTIDIAVDGENPWEKNYTVRVPGDTSNSPDLKPSQTGYINFTVKNVGTNPLDLWKMIDNVGCNTGAATYYCDCGEYGSGNVSSEPECVAMCANQGKDKNDIDKWMYFDLSVDGEVIIPDESVRIGDVKGKYIYLGRLEPGHEVVVNQSFHLYNCTPNDYQGDVMEFDERLEAYQVEGYQPEPTPTYSP